eukprot:gnl/TRDRNA2_/TRDRNA2_135285_c0_seq1.p1 gnl/TRDRNA2_/TRDRNA2_135285_c0~~gnl/TRDRNA2_/TRDRNA2_135285_c0_seq1.p1  ORF type:complete len:347 (+),score=66.74 gnl/TRDRNA2_/TRDRNA2_135285_c0_seq1:60-1100(+)
MGQTCATACDNRADSSVYVSADPTSESSTTYAAVSTGEDDRTVLQHVPQDSFKHLDTFAHKNIKADTYEIASCISCDTQFEVKRKVNEVLKVVGEKDRDQVQRNIYAIAALAWNERDAEICELRRLLHEAQGQLVKVAQDVDQKGQSAERMVIVSSAIPNRQYFVNCVKNPEWVVEYDHDKTSLADLDAAIDAKAKLLKPLTVSFANHGADDQGVWSIAKDLSIDVTGAKPELSQEAKEFFKHVGSAAQTRVDLLACDLAGTPSGLSLIKELEDLTGRHFAASTNHTGNLKHGGDWVMETDHVDTAAIYFDPQALYKWNGALARTRNATASQKKQLEQLRNGGGWI